MKAVRTPAPAAGRPAAGNLVMADIDTAAWKENFAVVAAHGADDAALFFYSYPFLRYPETRGMFRPR